jgi:MFS family permease
MLAESHRALGAVNFFVGGVFVGFVPFVALFLGGQGWSPQNVGFVLTAGTTSGVLAQIPGGELLDMVRSKRFALGIGIVTLGFSALIIGFAPNFHMVLVALMLQGATGAFIWQTIVALSMGLVTPPVLPRRLGRNQHSQAVGSLAAAGLMGGVGYEFSNRFIFFTVALLMIPAIVFVTKIHSAHIHFGRSIGAPDHHTATSPLRARRATVWQNPSLGTFAASLFTFQMANASILPLVGELLGHRESQQSALITALLVIVPQLFVAIVAPWTGWLVQSWGCRLLLLIAFGALPIHAFLFAMFTEPVILVTFQILDGTSGIMLYVLQPLVIADLAGRGGRFNLAQGFVGLLSGIGASLSTALSGFIVGNWGLAAGFVAVSVIAMIALGILWAFMPETRPADSRP